MKSQIHEWKEALKNITLKNCAITLLGSFILAFGLYHVHSISGVTEGGVLGATLLLEHWTGISPAFTGGIMNVLCYVLGWKLLGKEFIAYSALATVGFSGTYKICEQFPHLWPGLADMPLVAALVGALLVGVGAGLCVRIGGAPSGDDALAMSISHATGWKIQWVYLLSLVAEFGVMAIIGKLGGEGVAEKISALALPIFLAALAVNVASMFVAAKMFDRRAEE